MARRIPPWPACRPPWPARPAAARFSGVSDDRFDVSAADRRFCARRSSCPGAARRRTRRSPSAPCWSTPSGRCWPPATPASSDPHDHAEEVALARWPARPAARRDASTPRWSPACGACPAPGPAAELIVAAGISRVVLAWLEPPLFVPGGGAAWLARPGRDGDRDPRPGRRGPGRQRPPAARRVARSLVRMIVTVFPADSRVIGRDHADRPVRAGRSPGRSCCGWSWQARRPWRARRGLLACRGSAVAGEPAPGPEPADQLGQPADGQGHAEGQQQPAQGRFSNAWPPSRPMKNA